MNQAIPQPTSNGADGLHRCSWCMATQQYQRYHDTEWGRPVTDDQRLFEKLCLEGFQAGLSWRTILEKRENFRQAFAGFDDRVLAGWGDAQIELLLRNDGIIRHRGKIAAALHNARQLHALQAEFGSLAAYVWGFEPRGEAIARHQGLSRSPASTALSADLKKRGWKFVGPTTVHSFMQAMGLINDHSPDCFAHAAVEQARAQLQRPRR